MAGDFNCANANSAMAGGLRAREPFLARLIYFLSLNVITELHLLKTKIVQEFPGFGGFEGVFWAFLKKASCSLK